MGARKSRFVKDGQDLVAWCNKRPALQRHCERGRIRPFIRTGAAPAPDPNHKRFWSASKTTEHTMEVTQQCVVALTWILKDTLGEELDVLDEPVDFLIGGDDLFKRIEDALQGHVAGDKLDLHLEPEEAFGDYNESLIFLEKRELFPEEIEEGMTFESTAMPKGTNPVPADLLYTVTEIYPEHVVLDGNHPLAGIAIRLHLKIEGVRQATEEEVGRGTAGTGFFRIEPMAPGNDTVH